MTSMTLLQARIVAYLEANPDARAAEIASATGARANYVHVLAQRRRINLVKSSYRPRAVRSHITVESIKRGISRDELVKLLLNVIEKDGMVDAILDD